MWFLRLGLDHGFVKVGKENDSQTNLFPSIHHSKNPWSKHSLVNKEKGVPANFWEESFIASDPVLQNQIKGFEGPVYAWNVIKKKSQLETIPAENV